MSDHNPADNFPETDDEFKTESGLKDDYDGLVVDGWFGTTANAGSTLFLFLKILADDGEEVERRYSCGDDWQSYDGGVTAEHPTKKHFNTNSNVGRLINAFMSLCEKEVRERSAELNRMGPRNAKLLVGFKFHWEVFPREYTIRNRETGEVTKGETNDVLPTKFLGIEGTTNPTAATQAPAAASPTTGATASDDPLASVDASTAAQIKVLAKAKTYPEWVDAVMALTGVVENATLMVALGDESFYNNLKG